MKCPKCHFDNPDDTRFCSNCGTQLLPPEEISLIEIIYIIKFFQWQEG